MSAYTAGRTPKRGGFVGHAARALGVEIADGRKLDVRKSAALQLRETVQMSSSHAAAADCGVSDESHVSLSDASSLDAAV